MKITVLRSKIHRATVTGADLNYEGSIGIDEDLIAASGLYINERVDIYNINNGERFSTYVIPLPKGSRDIVLNGAAARLAYKGDKIIIASYGSINEIDARSHRPKVVLVDEGNNVI